MEENQQIKKKAEINKWALGIIILIVIIAIGNSNGSKTNTSLSPSSQTQIETRHQVEVIDLSSMTTDDIAAWCKEQRIECYKTEDYSTEVAKGSFVSQSVKAGRKTYEGEKLTITYSLGKEPSTEYKNALKKAESYSNTMSMSKKGIYDQLVSDYGEQFPADAAQYAIDNIVANWNANALAKAKSYQKTMNMSKKGIYDQLISGYGEQFTPAEATYAIENLGD